MKFIDLFCGIGGFRVALEPYGDCVFSSEIDSHAADAYKRNYGELPTGDIRDVNVKDIPEHNVLCAGFPCQSFSISGNHSGFEDSRGALFFDIVRITKHHKPEILILENVPHILKIDGGEVNRVICKTLDGLGYRIKTLVLNSAHFMTAQSRTRVFYVAVRNDLSAKIIDPYGHILYSMQPVTVGDIALSESETESMLTVPSSEVYWGVKNYRRWTVFDPILIGYRLKPSDGGFSKSMQYRIYDSTAPAPTQMNSRAPKGFFRINNRIRRLHIKEQKIVGGFPVSHIVSDGNKGYEQLGNSVVPECVRRVYKSIEWE